SDSFARHVSPEIEFAFIGDPWIARRLYNGPEQERALVRARESVDHRLRIALRDNGDHPYATVERTQHFITRDVPGFGEPTKHRQHWHLGKVDARAEPFRKHAWNVVREAAAGDVSEPLDRFRRADDGKARLHVDASRREDCVAECLICCKGRRRLPAQAGFFDNLSYERISVGMNAR